MRNATLLTLLVFALRCQALARSYTPRLDGFFNKDQGVADQAAFRSYLGELGLAIAPHFLGPASTLGSMGFELSTQVGIATINSGRDYWQMGAQSPGNAIITQHIGFRKGLPYSLEIGARLFHVYESSTWGLGLRVGWAALEGFKYAPDIKVLATVGTILGAGDLALVQSGMAWVVSKWFSIAGLFALAPYAGYHMVFVYGSSYLTSTGDKLFVLAGENVFKHRGVIGLAANVSMFTMGAEISLGPAQTVYAFKVGTAF